jgi:Uma2 family endonuclease
MVMTPIRPKQPAPEVPEIPEPVVVTPEQYEELPETSRIELVDGVVHVMTPALRRHQKAVDALNRVLSAKCPEDLVVVREQEVRMDELLRRNPDIMVVNADADDLDVYGYQPADVLLAIEVVGPHSRTVDRIHKLGEYASAKIEHYWYVELIPRYVVRTHRLGDHGRYQLTGEFTGDQTVAAAGVEWADFTVDEIAP